MYSKLSILALALVLSALILSGCATTAAQTTDPTPVSDEELCVAEATGAQMSDQEAIEIALNSACLEQGQLKQTRVCNEDTGTWWIDLDLEKLGCSPACVISMSDKTAEINWRCTGALPPTEADDAPLEAPDGVRAARDAALTYLGELYGAQAPSLDLTWSEEITTPGYPEEPLVGWSAYRFTSDGWVLTIGHAVLPPERIVYQIEVANHITGFEWEGEVDAAGQVTEHAATVDPSEQAVVAWYGTVHSLPAGAQYDDYLALLPEGTAKVGVEGADTEIQAEIAALRDTATRAHFWGRLICEIPDYGGCQLVVSRLRADGPGPFFDPDLVEGWEGTIYAGPPGPRSGGDDYFVLMGEMNVQYGIDAAIAASGERELAAELASLRDTGTAIRVWGQLIAGVPDWNGTQIQVSRIEMLEGPSLDVPLPPVWSAPDDGRLAYTNVAYGYGLRVPSGATITETGVQSFPGDELPAGTTADEYLTQLENKYPDGLCVHIAYGLGYMYISAAPNAGFRYATCGRTGVGAGEMLDKADELTIAGQSYVAQGYEFIGASEPCDSLACHNETMLVILEDGTRIEYGSRPEPTASYEDYLAKGREMLLQIITSYETIQ